MNYLTTRYFDTRQQKILQPDNKRFWYPMIQWLLSKGFATLLSKGFDNLLSKGFDNLLSKGFATLLSKGFATLLSKGFDNLLSKGFDNGTGLRPYIQGYIQSSISRNEWGIELSVKGKGTRLRELV